MTVPLQVRTDPPKPEDVKAQYGFVALIAQQIPEVGGLMEQAVRENWTPDRFSLALANTGWWKTTPDAGRQWLVTSIADPATAEQQLQVGQAGILQDLIEIGVHPYDSNGNPRLDTRALYLRVRLGGMEKDDAARRAFLFKEGNQPSEWDNQGGRYGQLVSEMLKLTHDYGYTAPGASREITGAANAIMLGGGTGTAEAWKRKMIQYAKAKYGAFADRLEAGESVMDLARPYLDSYAKVLEVAPGDVSLQDNMVQKALQGNGQQAAAVWQFEQELRKDDRYGYTRGARQDAASTVQAIGRAFGMVG